MSPTGLLMGAMLKYGLRPGGIVWDHEPHRFPGKEKPASNRSGWYVAFADRRGAVFGDYSQGLRQHWRLDHDGPFDRQDRERWRAERRKRAKERAEKAAIALEAMREAWDEASDTVDHPYLERKGIDEPVGGIRQHGETLFIPAYEDDGTLSNVQRIYYDRDGKQQKRFWKGRSSKGCRLTLAGARFAATNTLNLCEGYATAYSIHKATNEAVVVAFNDHGLVEVGRSLRAKYPDAKIVVCADNDQWSTILRGKEELPNPGVVYAQEACEAIGGVLRIPQFEDLGTKPTDFDDLRQLEGIPAVRHWLENEPPEATPVAGEVEERIESDREDWRETAPFRCLGYNEGRYLYLPKTTGQVESITKRSHSMPSYLLALHDEIAWWARHWPGPNRSTRPVNWYQAMVGLMGECHRQGVFVTENLRGIGAWRDESGGVVLHLGDRLLPAGEKKYVLPETYEDGARVYPRLPRVIGPATDKAMPLQEAKNIYELFTKDLLWEDEASGMLLAGFTVLAAFCGALAWRPSVWLTGGQGCGKSTIQEHIVKPLLGGMCKQYQGGTTEAAIRQTIQADALPVLYDEAERDGIKAKQQMDAVIRLIRTSASTGGDVVKGSPTGKAVTYKARSMFCLAAIGGGLTEEADKARITILPLMSKYVVPEDVRRKQWDRLKKKLACLTPQVGRRLLARTAKKFRSGEFDRILEVAKAAATGVFGDARSGDQYGTLCAGAWMLMHDRLPKEDEVRHWMLDSGIQEYVAESEPEGQRILSLLLQAQEIVDGSKYAVGELVEIAAGPERETGLAQKVADRYLKQLGIRVVDNALHLANRSEWIKAKMAPTPFAASWPRTLRTIKGVEASGKAIRFHSLQSKTTRIPLPLPPYYAPSSQASKRRATLTPDL